MAIRPFRGIATDPIRNFKFRVEFPSVAGGTARAGFSRVSGLKETTEAVDYREGTDPARPRKLIGQTSYDNITCERGITTDTELVNWRRLVKDPSSGWDLGTEAIGVSAGGYERYVRRDIDVILGDYYAETGLAGAWVWTVIDAWPVSYEPGELAGDGNDVMLEMVEFAHEGMDVELVSLGRAINGL